MRRASSIIRRTIRAVRLAATDPRIPRPLRWLAALGLAPIPGPFDEVLLVIVAVPLALFYRVPLADAWGCAAEPAYLERGADVTASLWAPEDEVPPSVT